MSGVFLWSEVSQGDEGISGQKMTKRKIRNFQGASVVRCGVPTFGAKKGVLELGPNLAACGKCDVSYFVTLKHRTLLLLTLFSDQFTLLMSMYVLPPAQECITNPPHRTKPLTAISYLVIQKLLKMVHTAGMTRQNFSAPPGGAPVKEIHQWWVMCPSTPSRRSNKTFLERYALF